MPPKPLESSERPDQKIDAPISTSSSQHGFPSLDLSNSGQVGHADSSRGSRSTSSPSVCPDRSEILDAVSADRLDERLRELSLSRTNSAAPRLPVAGQRVSDHEKAFAQPAPKQALGFKVTRRPDSFDGPQLADFPNEVLTHILSYLHPDCHAAVALTSKRLYALVTTPHAWRMAFMRYFPGHTLLDSESNLHRADVWKGTASDLVRGDVRYFGRLTILATWRSEYLLRTRLMRSLARGKPSTSAGGIGSSGESGKSSRRKSAVLTFNSRLPWLATNVHAVFANGKKPPRAIQGAGDLGVATVSDPTTGKIEKWGLEDPFSSAQLEEITTNLEPFGLGDGPVAIPNVMDVSQPYGIIAGEGFPGGRAYFRSINESCGRYLGGDTRGAYTYPDVPKIPEMSDAVCSVWIAKSSTVPVATQSMCGMLTGSALGIVTAFALGWDPNGPRFANGDMTARWVLSPGVPIISLKVDDNYSVKRRSSSRVWAVALNALGEVYYLTEIPVASHGSFRDDVTRHAWLAGRAAYWHLVESTRRVAQPHDHDKNIVRGSYTPRSPSNSMNLSKEQLAAEARELEKFLLYKPSHFRRVCRGWDMRRKLEVDFAHDDGKGGGEHVFVIECGFAETTPPSISRYTRSVLHALPRHQLQQFSEGANASEPAQSQLQPSIFGSTEACRALPRPSSPNSLLAAGAYTAQSLHEWHHVAFGLKGSQRNAKITASCLDNSSHSLLTMNEDPLHSARDPALGTPTANPTAPSTPLSGSRFEQSSMEIPGRRARLLVIGTNVGTVCVWNCRDEPRQEAARPIRVFQTDSPEISVVAASALYVVHGGSDGLSQAWDPLASISEPIRTLNSRSNSRIPRHMMTMNLGLRGSKYAAVGAIFLDPDPTVLRGVLSFGSFLRYWTYSTAGYHAGRKRRVRHSDIHGRIASRRLGGTVSGYIAAEQAELRRDNDARAKEQAHLRKRFGVGALGDLTEEEALRYAEMVSRETYNQEEQRRASDSAVDADAAATTGQETASSVSEMSVDTITPEPSVTDVSPPPRDGIALKRDEESDLEQQIQQAIRLSLMEGINDAGQSPKENSSGEFGFPIKLKAKPGKKSKSRGCRGSPTSSSPGSTSHTPVNAHSSTLTSLAPGTDDGDFALALSLSMQEQEDGTGDDGRVAVSTVEQDEFPPLNGRGVDKGKGVSRW